MRNLWYCSGGKIQLEINSADISGIITQLAHNDLKIFNVILRQPLVYRAEVNRVDYKKIGQIILKRGDTYRIVQESGLYALFNKMKKQPVRCISFLLLFILCVWLPTRVLFVKVEGNSQIPSKLIIEKAQKCGITFGASRRAVRSEHVKNALQAEIPELQWLGVNTSGCTATITVREKRDNEPESNSNSGVTSIVANKEGIIISITVLKGTPICKVGQVVQPGELLISGYSDCGISILATNAEAEVLAMTQHRLHVQTPIMTYKRTSPVSQKCYYSLRLGKKQIKLYNDSGIYDATCVKMYEEVYLTLPGGFTLPIALIKEKQYQYEIENAEILDYSWLKAAGEAYLNDAMIGGLIVHSETSIENENQILYLSGYYNCIEMIGITKTEEIIENHGHEY